MSNLINASTLLAAQEAQKVTHIWEVEFEIKAKEDLADDSIPEEILEDLDGWFGVSLTVAGGVDGEAIIQKLKEYVRSPEVYGITVTEFRLCGLKILAEAEVL